MKHRTHRLRRLASAVVLGVGAVGGVVGLAAGTAGATVHGTISATSAPSVGSTGTGVLVGSLTITLPSGTALSSQVLTLKASATGGGTVDWSGTPSYTHTSGTLSVAVTTSATTLKLTITKAAATSDTIHLTNVEYTLTSAHGTIKVTPSQTSSKLVITPTSVVNAKAPGAPATAPTTKAITAASTPSIGKGATSAAGNWAIKLTASSTKTTALKQGWTKTEEITVSVATSATANCSGTDFIVFTGTPTATVSGTTHVSTTPKVTVTTGSVTPCSGRNRNEAIVTFTNTGTFTAASGTFTITLSGVKYDVGKTAATGNVAVTAAFNGTAFKTATKISATSTPAGASNATVAKVYAKANTPAVTLAPGSFDAAISPVEVVETAPSTVASGGVCLSLTPHTTTANVFNTRATATAKVVTGTGVVTAKVSYENKTGVAATTAASAVFARFTLKRSSVTKASTYEVSGLKVNASTTAGAVKVAITHVAATAGCTTSPTLVAAPVVAYTVKSTTTVIYGATADATAVKELEHEFPTTSNTANATPTKTKCPGNTDLATATAVRPVILATTKTYQDALSSSYLAGYLKTGTLLTPTTMLASVTKQALRTEGITQVYVVGGPLAITTTVVAQIEALPAYSCGGVTPLKSGKTTVTIHVTRIYGQTAYGTAQMIAETPAASNVKKLTFTGAYAGVNATKGDGMYNTTPGMASTVPFTSASVRTAILASGVEFQDAMAASAVAYGTSVPVLLTTPTKLSAEAAAAIATLGIRQVILMGGQLAVSNTVVKQLEAMTVSVLRIAGKNYTGTAVQLAMFEQNTAHVSGLGWPTGAGKMTSAYVARGNGFTDALAGAVLTGNAHLPQLLTLNPTTVGATLTSFLKAAGTSGKGVNTDGTAKITTLTILGGPLAVSPSTIAKMETDIS